VAIDHEDIVLGGIRAALGRGDLMLELALDGVVLDLICKIIRVGRDIGDGDDIDHIAQQSLITDCLENQAADTAKSIDTHFNCHSVFLLIFSVKECS